MGSLPLYSGTPPGHIRARIAQHFSTFREVTLLVFEKVAYQGPSSPLPTPPRSSPKYVKRNVLGTTQGAHLGEEHVK